MAEAVRSAVVTGTSKGIGRGIGARLVADGWLVVGVERRTDTGTVESGAAHAVVIGDSGDRDTHRRAAETARSLAPLGGWVNNAGITLQTPLHDLDESTVRRVVETNGLGYLWGAAVAVQTFVDQVSGGSIVNIGSIHGRASHAHHAAYEFTKGGIDALSRSIAVTYGPVGIRANTIAPGGIWTPHLEAQLAAADDREAMEAELNAGPPARRIGRTEEVAALTSFLLSDQATYLSGESIAIDGAWTASFGHPDLDPEILTRYRPASE